ncbi:hypothetical protein [Spirosoma agri]|jgi:hypothetical protein|uniref:Uncharacterized protein n=1 Tax=Spirosoma agri TaxID=1987381 RepID=A0A6M0IJ66_9BACT|nr:hypothetical protein [Spirosoma agri]NEU68254.1 hypothetical protein [Spirosoma agri]
MQTKEAVQNYDMEKWYTPVDGLRNEYGTRQIGIRQDFIGKQLFSIRIFEQIPGHEADSREGYTKILIKAVFLPFTHVLMLSEEFQRQTPTELIWAYVAQRVISETRRAGLGKHLTAGSWKDQILT